MTSEKKIDFLKFAIEDAQELIRYTDAKTVIATSIIGAFIVGIFALIEKIVKYYSNYNFWFWILLVAFIILLIVCTRVTARIIKPTTNPVKNINMGGAQLPKIKFFLAQNNYNKNKFYPYKNSDDYKLVYSYQQYLTDISVATEEDIIETLSFELLKVSYIRNIKNDRFNKLVGLLIFSSMLFSVFYLLYNIETVNILKKRKKRKKIP